MSEDVKVINVTATPIDEDVASKFCDTAKKTAETLESILESFSNEIPADADLKTKEAKKKINSFRDYIKSTAFKNDINSIAKKYKVPPRQLAHNFFEKVLGTIGDILGMSVQILKSSGHIVVNVVSTIGHGIVDVVTNIADALVRLVTLNKTCIA